MNIEDMSEQEKSKLLCELLLWQPAVVKGVGFCWIDENYELLLKIDEYPSADNPPNLYAPENAALVARVMKWAIKPKDFFDFVIGAQGFGLDAVLYKAKEAGRIE